MGSGRGIGMGEWGSDGVASGFWLLGSGVGDRGVKE